MVDTSQATAAVEEGGHRQLLPNAAETELKTAGSGIHLIDPAKDGRPQPALVRRRPCARAHGQSAAANPF